MAYVEMPDYECSLFEAEEGLLNGIDEWGGVWGTAAHLALQKAIQASKNSYKAEYDEIRRAAREIYDTRNGPLHAHGYSTQPRWMPGARSLTFAEFARLKAYCLVQEAIEAVRSEIRDQGYANSDHDGCEFRVHGGERPVLEAVGFDFEYYKYEPEEAKQAQAEWQKRIASGEVAASRVLRICRRRITAAAAYAMMHKSGHGLPKEA